MLLGLGLSAGLRNLADQSVFNPPDGQLPPAPPFSAPSPSPSHAHATSMDNKLPPGYSMDTAPKPPLGYPSAVDPNNYPSAAPAASLYGDPYAACIFLVSFSCLFRYILISVFLIFYVFIFLISIIRWKLRTVPLPVDLQIIKFIVL